MSWISESDWERATMPRWKLRILRIVLPFGWFVRIGGKTYFFRNPPRQTVTLAEPPG